MGFNERSLDDYIDVPQRIAEFREQYPEGSLQPVDPKRPYRIETVSVALQQEDGSYAAVPKTFIVYAAAAYRTPTDRRPGIGVAWEPVPGQTPYTRNSELMNAETSAWGRAIVAVLAADAKRGISTRSEVAARRAEREQDRGGQGNGQPGPLAQGQPAPPANGNGASPRLDGAGFSPEAQALADTAKRVRKLDSLRNVHAEATRKHLLRAPVASPQTGEAMTLHDYIQERKTELEVAANDPAYDGSPT